MSTLNNMYGKKKNARAVETISTKNPNRVAGGIRGQGGDHFTMLGEDGSEQQIPTHRYVQSLEEQIKLQRGIITGLEKKMNRMTRSQEALESAIVRMNSRS